MFLLTKQQVKSLLEVIGNDDARPILQQLKIDLFNDKPVLVTTDSYQMAIFALSDNVLPEMGKIIDRKEIAKWYKLASAKDLFTEVDLIDAPATEDGNYPKWQTLIPKREDMTGIPSLSLNPTYLLNLGKLAGNTGMILEFYGRIAPIVSRTGDNIFVLMPLATKLKELAEQQISYYRQHKVGDMVEDIRTRAFVIEDYVTLLTVLAKEFDNENA
jgi:hypothetical protein